MMYVPINLLITCNLYWFSNTILRVNHLFLSFLYKISNLIATEILRCDDVVTRVVVIEKWVAVADICRCLHNYNAVLEITSSLNRSSVFRLKKTWLKVSKQVLTYIPLLIVCFIFPSQSCLLSLNNLFLPDEGINWQAAEAGLIRGEVQKPERGFEKVSSVQGCMFCTWSIKQTSSASGWRAFLPPAVILPVCPIWECTLLTWLSLRREHPTTPKTTWSTSQRWEWWDDLAVAPYSVCRCMRIFHNFMSCFSCVSDFSHHQRNQAVSANSLQAWPSTKGKWIAKL